MRLRDLVALFMLATTSFSADESATRLDAAARQQLARQYLESAEANINNFEPCTRALLLYRIAGAWVALDRDRAIHLYRDSFIATRNSQTAFKPFIQQAILNDLLPLSPGLVVELLPAAEHDTQKPLYSGAINYFLFEGDYSGAVHAFESALTAGVWPRSTPNLWVSLPEPSSADRLQIFKSALAWYKSSTKPTGLDLWLWTLPELVERSYKRLPREFVLQAIDAVVTKAGCGDKDQGGGGWNGSLQDNRFSFKTYCESQLFAVAPALRHLDPARASALLASHPDVANLLERYPEGLSSLNPNDFMWNAHRISPAKKPQTLLLYSNVIEERATNDLDLGLEFTMSADPHPKVMFGGVTYFYPNSPEGSIVESGFKCSHDVEHRLEQSKSIPILRKEPVSCGGSLEHYSCSYRDTYPRADVLQALAAPCALNSDPAPAFAVLHEMTKLLGQMAPRGQIAYLATEADFYLRLQDAAAARQVVERSFAAASATYLEDAQNEKLKGVPAGYWFAAEAYRRIISLGVNTSLQFTQQQVAQIPDPALKQLEQLFIARALLGVPVQRTMTASSGSFCQTEGGITYDQF